MQGEQNWSRQRWSRIVPGEHFEHFQIKSTNSYIFCALVPLDGQLRLSGCPKLESHLWRFHPLQPNHHHFWRLSDYINEDMIIKDVETKLQISGLVMSTSRMNMKRLTFTLKFTLLTALKNMIPTLLWLLPMKPLNLMGMTKNRP